MCLRQVHHGAGPRPPKRGCLLLSAGNSTRKSDDKDIGPRVFKQVARQVVLVPGNSWWERGGGGDEGWGGSRQCERMPWKAWRSYVLGKL